MAELVAQLDQTTMERPPARRGLGNPAPQASSALRRRVTADQEPITVAEPLARGGTLNVLVLLDRPGRSKEAVEAVVDRIGPQLGRIVLCVPMERGTKWGRVAMTLEQLRAFVEQTSFGARVALGPRDETVAVEACEGEFRLVVDLTEDPDVRRTLRMCAIAYVVGPQGVARFAEESSKRPRLLTPPRDADRSDWTARPSRTPNLPASCGWV